MKQRRQSKNWNTHWVCQNQNKARQQLAMFPCLKSLYRKLKKHQVKYNKPNHLHAQVSKAAIRVMFISSKVSSLVVGQSTHSQRDTGPLGCQTARFHCTSHLGFAPRAPKTQCSPANQRDTKGNLLEHAPGLIILP